MMVGALALGGISLALPAAAATIYETGVSPNAGLSGLTFGTHLVSGPHASVGGVGGSGVHPTGSVLDGSRTYIWDKGGATDLAAGVANRSSPTFAMMIWDMGAKYDSLRLYTHQDHYNGGPITDNFVGQDVMEYSIWGSNDGDNFSLLSDVTAFDLTGGGPGLPTYTFVGTEPSVVYRGGSDEFGTLNAYTREYVFGTGYQYYGIRASTVTIVGNDADPELDAIAAFNIATRPPGTPGRPPTGVPDGGSTAGLLGASGVLLMGARKWLKR